jgi:hypothetical protein
MTGRAYSVDQVAAGELGLTADVGTAEAKREARGVYQQAD